MEQLNEHRGFGPALARRTGALVLSEANDLKRTVEAMAEELEQPAEQVLRLVAGEGSFEEYRALAAAMARVYPVDETQLHPLVDDCVHGARIMRAAESAATARTVQRTDRRGRPLAYYEYRDTAFSAVSPFRPEWIKQLSVVDDTNPDDPGVVFNRGHLLHQYTVYLGPVNYYWEVDGERFGTEMRTGDSTYGTPWWPHTFTSRDADREARILAVTFGSAVRRSLRELYVLGPRATAFTLPYRRGAAASARALIARHLQDGLLTAEELDRRLAEAEVDVRTDQILAGSGPVPSEVLAGVACALDVEVFDLMVPEYRPEDEVRIQRIADVTPIVMPGPSDPSYSIRPLARVSKAPSARGSLLATRSTSRSSAQVLETSLHSWIYNVDAQPVRVWWSDGNGSRETVLAPDDSMYLQPWIAHRFWTTDEPGQVCVMRVGGSVGLEAQRELSYLSSVSRALEEDGQWY